MMPIRTTSEPYSEGPDSVVVHNGYIYNLDIIFRETEKTPVTVLDIDKLSWIVESKLNGKDPDFIERMNKADTDVPIIVIRWKDKWVIIDGYHRLCKAIFKGHRTIKVKIIKEFTLKKALKGVYKP